MHLIPKCKSGTRRKNPHFFFPAERLLSHRGCPGENLPGSFRHYGIVRRGAIGPGRQAVGGIVGDGAVCAGRDPRPGIVILITCQT